MISDLQKKINLFLIEKSMLMVRSFDGLIHFGQNRFVDFFPLSLLPL